MTDASGEFHDVAIIGAGVVGSSLAMALSERGLTVAVLDPDLSGRLGSSERNAGGVRATWWQPVNISLCRASIRYYETIRDEAAFRQKGYLWLYDAETWPKALFHIPLQRRLGHPIEELTAREVSRRVPEIDRLGGIAGATFSSADGLINPNLLKGHYRARSRERGATYMDRTCVNGLDIDAQCVRMRCWQSELPLSDEALERILVNGTASEPGSGRWMELKAEIAVVCAGAWSPNILRMAGLDTPAEAVRRQISVVDNRSTNLSRYGMIVDTSGIYFHNDGPCIMAGYSLPEESPGYCFRYDGDAFFENEIWPRLYARMSCFERLRHVSGWAGLYAVTPDRSAIVGRAGNRLYEAHSFSGRGVMQSYGAGQALGDLIANGKYGDLDASPLSRERFASGALITEQLHI